MEHLFDGQSLFFYFLGEVTPEIERLSAELAELYEATVKFREFTEALTNGCGPGCGTAEAEGPGCGSSCSSCVVSGRAAPGENNRAPGSSSVGARTHDFQPRQLIVGQASTLRPEGTADQKRRAGGLPPARRG